MTAKGEDRLADSIFPENPSVVNQQTDRCYYHHRFLDWEVESLAKCECRRHYGEFRTW
jgi:hypothetical protein